MSKSVGKLEWENSDFPIVCESCLGDNPYLRMSKLTYGGECLVCNKPFTSFRWCPGKGSRFKKTELCQTCAKLKHCCQSCMFDLEYGLPTQVRDAVLNIHHETPKTEVNRQYFARNIESQLDKAQPYLDTKKADSKGRELLRKLARQEPYQKRNKASICTFYLKGECTRGDECIFNHELPEPHELIKANPRTVKERYFGQNDPVADKYMEKAKTIQVNAPQDLAITSVYLSGVTNSVTEQMLRDYFYAFGEIRSIVVLHKKDGAFVNYVTRDAAERAVNSCMNDVVIDGIQISVSWARPKQQGPQEELVVLEHENGMSNSRDEANIPLPPSSAKVIQYPSQDPNQMGSRKN